MYRHPEAAAKRPIQVGYCRLGHLNPKSGKPDFGWGDGPGASAGILRGPLRSHLRMTEYSGARVGGAVGADQALGVDFGIDLRRRQRGMTEQFLDRAEVAAAGEQVRGEGMPQRVRRRRL